MFDILGIGEALVEFAETKPSEYRQSFAGDIINTLFYASQLGLRASFFSTFGKDTYTNDLLAFLNEAGIDHSSCKISRDKNNGLYVIRSQDNGEPEFTFFRENSAARTTFADFEQRTLTNLIGQTKVVIFSGIVLAVFRDVEKLIELLRENKNKTIVYFDVNVRQALWPDITALDDWIGRIASVVDIISLSVSDDEKIFGSRSSSEMIECYREYGYSMIILRDGANDVLLNFDGKTHTVPVHPEQTVVDATGAGDAFNAAFIYSYLGGRTPEVSAKMGNSAAAQVLRYHGGIVKEFDPCKILLQQ
ncbi:MAG TPA: sugar kinase [Candidatus Kapabacteria bacterium]|nr:sugar kinase [Candidatus Kapabacteria bacterium]